MSIGDLLVGLTRGGPQMGYATPNPTPNPNPQVQPFHGPSEMAPPAGAPPPASPPLPAAQTYAPDPSVGNSIQQLMQMHEQDRRANAIDRGIAGMASSFGPVADRASIRNSFPQQDDRIAAMGGAIRDAAGMQQLEQQQRMLEAMRSGALGQLLGVGGAAPTAGGAPDPAAALLQFGTPQQVQEYLAQRAQAGTEIQTKGQETKNADLLEAQQKAPGAIVQMGQLDDLSNKVREAVNADGTPVIKSIMDSSVKKIAAGELLDAPADPGVVENVKLAIAMKQLSPEEQAAVMNLKQLRGQIYGEAFQSTGSRRTQQEVQNIKTGIDPLNNFSQPYDAYMKQFDAFQNTLHKGLANTYGAAQLLNDPRLVPHRDLVDPEYLPKGPLYAGAGGEWAANRPPPTSTAIHAPSDFSKMTSSAADEAFAKLPSGATFMGPDGQMRRKP